MNDSEEPTAKPKPAPGNTAKRALAFLRDPSQPLWIRGGTVALIAMLLLYPFLGKRDNRRLSTGIDEQSFPVGEAGFVDSPAGLDQLRVQTQEITGQAAKRKDESAGQSGEPEAAGPAPEAVERDADAAQLDAPELGQSDGLIDPNEPEEKDERTPVVSEAATPFRLLTSIAPHPVALATSPAGLWVADRGGVLLLKDGDPEQVTAKLEPKSYETEFNDDLSRISSILVGTTGDLWVGFQRGQVMRHDKYGWKIAVRPGEQLRAPVSSLIEFDGSVRLTSRGLWKWSEAVQRLVPTKTFEQRTMTSLLVSPQGSLYAAGEGGIWVFNSEQRSWKPFWKTNEEDAAVFTMHGTADGTLYAGTKNGVVVLSPNAVVTERMLAGERISAIAIDRQSHLWVGTRDKGLRYFNGQFWHSADSTRGLSNRINAILFDSGDRMWIAAEQGGLLVADRSQILPWIAQYAEVVADANEPKIFPDVCDAALALLKGVAQSGTISIDTIDGKQLVFFDGVQRCPKGIGYRRADGAVLLKNDWVLTIFRNDERSTVEIPKEYAADTVTAALLDSRNQIWLGTHYKGFYRHADNKWNAFGAADGFENNAVTSLLEDPTGMVWVASMPSYDKATSKSTGANLHALAPTGWVHLTPAEGLGGWSSLGMVLLRNANLLLATNAGLSIINQDGEIATFGARDGMKPFFSYFATLDGRGRVWIAHQYFGDGVTWFDGEQFYRLARQTKLFNSRITWIAHDRIGRVWLVGSNGSVGVYPLQYFEENQVAAEVRKQKRINLVN